MHMCTCTYGTHIYIGYVHCTMYFWKSDFFLGCFCFFCFWGGFFGTLLELTDDDMCNMCYWGGGGWWFQFGVILYKNQANNIFPAVNLPLTSTAMKCQHSSPYV